MKFGALLVIWSSQPDRGQTEHELGEPDQDHRPDHGSDERIASRRGRCPPRGTAKAQGERTRADITEDLREDRPGEGCEEAADHESLTFEPDGDIPETAAAIGSSRTACQTRPWRPRTRFSATKPTMHATATATDACHCSMTKPESTPSRAETSAPRSLPPRRLPRRIPPPEQPHPSRSLPRSRSRRRSGNRPQ
jgi:hypothetical protein